MVILYISSFCFGVLLLNFAAQAEFLKLFSSLILLLLLARRLVGFSGKFFRLFGWGMVTALARIYLGDLWDFDPFHFEFSFLRSLRMDILGRLAGFFAPNENAFLAGLLIGERENLSSEIVMDFSRTGLTHIMAISGYNVSIVVAFTTKILGFLSQRIRIVSAICFVVVFVVFVGASAPVVRAGIMGIIALLAIVFNRQYLACNGLFISAFVMIIFDPVIIYGSISFQLSFLATLGLLLFNEKLERFFNFLPERFFIRQSVVMTMSAQVLVLPIILSNFGNLSLISPLANVVVLPFIPLVMLGGFLIIVFSYVFNFVAGLLSIFVHLMLSFMLFEIHFLADLPFASVNLGWFSFWFALLYYYFVLWFWSKYSNFRTIFN